MKRNIADLPDVLRLSKRLGATQHLVTNVLPYTVELRDEVLYRRVTNDVLYLQSPWVPHLDLPRIETNELTRLPLDQVKRSLHNISLNGDNLSRASDRCPFIERGATVIAWDGNLSPCLPLAHNHVSYLDKRKRTSHCYTVGNINTNSLDELWNESQYTKFRKRVQKFDFSPCTFCGGCELSEANEEDCYGNTFPVCGGCLWAQGVIQCP
jgi:MoaA/NifB/PqqE/SkfB family radical SAM enzyme